MEVSHSLTLNEAALEQLPDDKKPHFIFEWLRFLDKVLDAANKSDIKGCQQKLVNQLMNLLRQPLGTPTRRLLAQCLATLFSVGDTFLLFDTVNKCNDIIKVKDDSPSYLPTRLAAICCLGSMYEKLGRMMGRSYEETVSTLVKSLKSAESQTRLEIMNTLEKICVGMGTAAPIALREVSRAARNALLSDRAFAVRAAAADCIRHMLPLMKLTPADLDSIAAACLRAAHPSDYKLSHVATSIRHMLPLIKLTPADLDSIAAACLRAAHPSDYKLRLGVAISCSHVATSIRHMLPLIKLTPADLDSIAAACLRAAHPSDYKLRLGVAISCSHVATSIRHMLPLIKLTPADLDSIAAACLRAAHPSDYKLRLGVAISCSHVATSIRHMLPLIKLTPADLDSIAAACLRAAHPSDYELRCAVAELLGALIAATQAGEATPATKLKLGQVPQSKKDAPKNVVSLEEALNLLMGAFLRGGTSFLKGEIIKTGSGVNREVRVCVTNAYVMFVQNMGGVWLERNLTTFLTHVLDLVANPKAASSHVDAVYSRKCINYILRNTLGKMLGEKAQASACKEIIQIVIKQMNSIDFNPENAKDCNQETLFSQHLLVCALTQAGELALLLGTSVQSLLSDSSLNMIDAICAVLAHPCLAARLAAAQALRDVCVASPAHITPLLDRCADALDAPNATPHHISGYSAALAAILGAVRLSPLGAPHGRGKIAFNAAEQLLRSAGQSSRLTAARTNAGWLIVGAICTLGTPVVKGLLPRMLLLWRNSFPRSAKELESEKARGDAFTWQVTLEGRAGALAALHSLLVHCPTLANSEDTAKRLTQPIEGAIAVLTNVGGIIRNYGGALKAPAALLRLRLYCACSLLGAAAAAAPLLRLLAAELAAAADTGSATVATGMLRHALHPRDTILLGEASWIYETDHAEIEEQLISPLSASGSGALEHDPCALYLRSDAQPLGVAVVDAAVTLFPLVFARAANKHRQQMLEHFAECIKMSKGSRQEAIQINVYTALLMALKTLAEMKLSLGQDSVKTVATEMIMAGLSSPSVLVRAAAASCAGRLCPCVSEAEAQALWERILRAQAAKVNTLKGSNRFANNARMVLALARTLRTSDVQRLRMVAWKQSTLAAANMPEALQNRGSPISTLNALLYWTRRAL
ncbi:unnamed protein product [Plutella xylostella]|uniref:(diamondback moth) hypothetical protein n=1 Tax=Plutella xylostella TaxID=51655 RepID=A0A8S4EBG3_PLUXY|nr:unnamed protein product [Plutella xylostella]